MSVINQMLRDLEQRNSPKTQTISAQEAQAWPIQHKQTPPTRLWLFGALILPIPLIWWMLNQGNNPTNQEPVASNSLTVATLPPTPVPTNQPAASSTDPLAPVVSAIANQVVQTAVGNGASTAVALPTTPEVAKAVQQAAAVITAEKPAVTAHLSLEAPTQPESQPQRTRSERPVVHKRQQPQIFSEDEPVKPKSANRPAKMMGQLAQVESLYQRAKRSHSMSETQDLLQEALIVDPYYLPARTLMLESLIKSAATDEQLAGYVDESLNYFPNNLLFLKTRAHLFVKQKEFASAVNILERVDVDTVSDAGYLSLLGAAYQQLQQHSGAEHIYRQLTQLQPNKAENWLGLAMAQDKLGQNQIAIDAYRQALDKGTLKPQVIEYIDTRISALN